MIPKYVHRILGAREVLGDLRCISSTDHNGRQFWVLATEREDAGRFIVRVDEKLPAFLELESAIRLVGNLC